MRRLAVLLTATLAVALLGGCGSSAATSASTTTSSAAPDPPDSRAPSAGACALATGAVATVDVRADFVPMPRCLVVRHDQRLQITNETGRTLDVSVGTRLRASIHDGDTYTTPDAIGRDLAPGVHRLRITSASAADLWVDAVCQGPGATSCVTP